MKNILDVGIIGANPQRGWAKVSHVAAVRGLAGLALGAIATTNQRSADEAARAFDARVGYGDARLLLADPAVDLVAVAVNVPEHRPLVMAAIAAGKNLYCEWPLGRDLRETEEMAAAADAAGIHAAIGLQARRSPAAVKARDLVASGAIGRVRHASILSTTVAFGPAVERAMAFAEDDANGVTLVTIQAAHTIDLAVMILGGLAEAAALFTTQFPIVTFEGDPTPRSRTTADHALIQARLASGPPLVIEVVGGRAVDDTPFRFAITGDAGELVLEGGAARGFQSGRLRLSVDGQAVAVSDGEASALSDEAVNVAGVYAVLRDEIRDRLHDGSERVAGFGHAVKLKRMMDALTAAARSGERVRADRWPTA